MYYNLDDIVYVGKFLVDIETEVLKGIVNVFICFVKLIIFVFLLLGINKNDVYFG